MTSAREQCDARDSQNEKAFAAVSIKQCKTILQLPTQVCQPGAPFQVCQTEPFLGTEKRLLMVVMGYEWDMQEI